MTSYKKNPADSNVCRIFLSLYTFYCFDKLCFYSSKFGYYFCKL